MSKRPTNPGRRKIPGVFRSHERNGPDPNEEAQRIVLYLPISSLDEAERQSIRERVETLQRYCEDLLINAIQSERDRAERHQQSERQERLIELRTIADDPEYLAEWTTSMLGQSDPPSQALPPPLPPPSKQTPGPVQSSETLIERSSVEIILRHAGLLGDDPAGFLARLRRGEPIGPDLAAELLRTLIELEETLRGLPTIDRFLTYALHKLAFEGQILATEGVAGSGIDEETIQVLRRLQESVDRILSGQDIRYQTRHEPIARIND